MKTSFLFSISELISESLQFEGGIKPSHITLADVACFAPILRKWNDALLLSTHFSGTSSSAHIHHLSLNTESGNVVLEANAKANKWDNQLRWNVNIEKLKVSDDGISHIAQNLGSKVKIPRRKCSAWATSTIRATFMART